MASTINTENLLQIRDGIDVTITIYGTSYVPILGTWTATTGTEYAGVLTHSATISSGIITLRANDDTEYVICDGETYYPNPSGLVIITTPDTSIYFYGEGATPYNTSVPTLYNGFACELDNRSITTLNLALRGNLDLVNPTWETSEINLSFVLPDTGETAMQYIATHISGANIYYKADYGNSTDADDTLRQFRCTNEGLEVSNKEVTLTGVDQSELLAGTQVPRFFQFTEDAGFNRLYALFRSFLTNAGISLFDEETGPTAYSGDGDTYGSVYMDEKPYSEYVLFFMRHILADGSNLTAYPDTFWPRYVDAGRAKVSWTLPTAKWTIKESECGDVIYGYEPAIQTLTISNDSCISGDSRETIETKTVVSGHKYAFEMTKPYRSFSVTNANILKENAMRVVVRATADGNATLSGIPLEFFDLYDDPKEYTIGTDGQELEASGSWHFEQALGNDGDGQPYEFCLYPDLYMQDGITQTVQFTWKGDPRMQPLDVFTFNRLDGTSETWTIGSITLDHTGGGMSAEITARKGVI